MRWFRVEVEWILNTRVTECSLAGCSSFWCLPRNETQATQAKFKDSCDVMEILFSRKWRIDYQNDQTSPFRGSRAYFDDFSWRIHNIFKWAAYRKPLLEVPREIFSTFCGLFPLLNNAMSARFWSIFKEGEQISINVFWTHRFLTKF